MAMGVRRAGSVMAEINVTPLADVMIVLLIIFMVALPALVQAPVKLPSAVHPREHKDKPLEIVVRASGEIAAGGHAFTRPESLAEWIATRREGDKQVVLVQADRSVAYATVSPVVAACRRAGVQEIAFAVERVER